MGWCTNALGIMMGGVAIAANAAALAISWYPGHELINKVLVLQPNIDLYARILPIIAICVASAATIILILDMKYDKMLFRVTSILAMLIASGILAAAAGLFIWTLVKVSISAATAGTTAEYASIAGITTAEMQTIIDNLVVPIAGNTPWDTASTLTHLDLNWGSFIAGGCAILDFIVAWIFATISCCGCN